MEITKGFVKAIQAVGDQAEEMEALSIMGGKLECALIGGLGLDKTTSLLMSSTLIERGLHRRLSCVS
jgi:hypothetical protein